MILSILSFGMITVERYFVICRGLQDHMFKTATAIAAAYLYSALFGFTSSISVINFELAAGAICKLKFCSRDPLLISVLFTGLIVVVIFAADIAYCPYKIMQVYALTKEEKFDSIQMAENKQTKLERKIKERAVFIKLSVVTIV